MENIKMYTNSKFIVLVISKGNIKTYSKIEGWTPKAAFKDFFRTERISKNTLPYTKTTFWEV